MKINVNVRVFKNFPHIKKERGAYCKWIKYKDFSTLLVGTILEPWIQLIMETKMVEFLPSGNINDF
jgi:hypothetical protein